MDIASMNGGPIYRKFSTGSGFTSDSWSVTNEWGPPDLIFAGKFNANSLADIASMVRVQPGALMKLQ
jgi:hypothetical protein